MTPTPGGPARDLRISDEPTSSRYAGYSAGGDRPGAVLEYQRTPGRVALVHTEVEPSLRGGGAAARMVRFALEDARNRSELVVPACRYVATYLRKHREYEPLVHPAHRERLFGRRDGPVPGDDAPKRDSGA